MHLVTEGFELFELTFLSLPQAWSLSTPAKETLLGREGFRKGMDLYFERHDGNAVTCDDFRSAMQDANDRDLTQFERWYLQAGTPTVEATDAWDAETETYSLTLKQTVPDTPGQMDKLPMQIPVRVIWHGKAV